jgi:hypothetical protein
MPDQIGTRTQQATSQTRADQGNETRNHSRDVGMTKRVSKTLTFGALLATAAVIAAPGGALGALYAPGDTITLAGGTSTVPTVLTVGATAVQSATINAGGSGGTTGTQTVTGTTGTGTKFQASVTVAGGAITAVLSITVAGLYTVNPTDCTQEPVTGASLTGAKLSLVMGVGTISVTTAGVYSVAPSNPVAQASSSGSGTGATFTMSYPNSGRIVAPSSNDLSVFALNDPLLVQNVNLNNGEFTVTGLDAVNHAYLVVDPPPKTEGPIAAVVRTI